MEVRITLLTFPIRRVTLEAAKTSNVTATMLMSEQKPSVQRRPRASDKLAPVVQPTKPPADAAQLKAERHGAAMTGCPLKRYLKSFRNCGAPSREPAIYKGSAYSRPEMDGKAFT